MKKHGKIKAFLADHSGEITASLLLIGGLVIYALWGFGRERLTVSGAAASVFALGMLAVGLAIVAPKAIGFFKGEPEVRSFAAGERSKKRGRVNPVIGAMLSVLIARLILLIVAYVIDLLVKGYNGTVFSTFKTIWFRNDSEAAKFFDVAENWYSSGNADNIVCFPLYPILIRALNFVFRSSFRSAFVINALCSVGAAAVIYKLALIDFGRRTSRTAVLFTFVMPAAFFFVIPTNEALFLLLCASALFMMRKDQFILSAIFISLASFTRAEGILLVLPYIAEAAANAVRFRSIKGKKGFAPHIVVLCVGLALSLLGTFAYLLMNRLIYGDWFRFYEVAADKLKLTPVFPPETPTQLVEGLIKAFGKENAKVLGLWIPNLIHVFGALAVFVAAARALRTSYAVYFAAYVAAMLSVSPLVSAPRLLSALVVLPIALAQLCESRDDGTGITRARIKTAAVASVLLAGQLLYLLMYILRYNII